MPCTITEDACGCHVTHRTSRITASSTSHPHLSPAACRCVNAVAWSPVSGSLICTVADDCMALIWDIAPLSNNQGTPPTVGNQRKLDPVLAYSAHVEVNNLTWSALQPDWVAICLDRKSQILKVRDPTIG